MAESEAAPNAPAEAVASEKTEVSGAAAAKSAPAAGKAVSYIPAVGKNTVDKLDELLVRVSRLIKTSAGLNAGLGFVNYGVYLLAYLYAVSEGSRAKLLVSLQKALGREPKLPGSLQTPPTTFLAPLGALLSDTRTTLRLTGLIPLSLLLKSLLDKSSPKPADPVSYRIALVQCLSYIAFQFSENVCHLTNKSIIPASFVEDRGGAAKWMQFSCRAWVVGILADFVKLGRQAQLNQQQRDRGELTVKEQQSFEAGWWTNLYADLAWLPMALHYSIDGGLSFMNPGLIALSGFVAYRGTFLGAWAATKS